MKEDDVKGMSIHTAFLLRGAFRVFIVSAVVI